MMKRHPENNSSLEVTPPSRLRAGRNLEETKRLMKEAIN